MSILPSQSSSQDPRSQLVMRRQILLRNASLGNNLRQQICPESWYRGQNWTNIIISGHSHLQIPFNDRVSKRIREWCHVSCLLSCCFWNLSTPWEAFTPLGRGSRNPSWVLEEFWLTPATTNETVLSERGQWETQALVLETRSLLRGNLTHRTIARRLDSGGRKTGRVGSIRNVCKEGWDKGQMLLVTCAYYVCSNVTYAHRMYPVTCT